MRGKLTIKYHCTPTLLKSCQANARLSMREAPCASAGKSQANQVFRVCVALLGMVLTSMEASQR